MSLSMLNSGRSGKMPTAASAFYTAETRVYRSLCVDIGTDTLRLSASCAMSGAASLTSLPDTKTSPAARRYGNSWGRTGKRRTLLIHSVVMLSDTESKPTAPGAFWRASYPDASLRPASSPVSLTLRCCARTRRLGRSPRTESPRSVRNVLSTRTTVGLIQCGKETTTPNHFDDNPSRISPSGTQTSKGTVLQCVKYFYICLHERGAA